MAIVRGNPQNVSIHHSAVRFGTGTMAELKQRAAAHDRHHAANSIAWNNVTSGEYGFKNIRYHYMISHDGSVLQVQHEKYALYANGDGTGANSFNRTAVNIMFEGNFSEQQPTEAMMLSAVNLIRGIQSRYKINPRVRGHKELSSTGTACPGSNLGTSKGGWVRQLINNINDPNYPKPKDWRDEAVALKELTWELTKDSALVDIDTGARVKEFKKGEKIEVAYEYKGYLITKWSYDRQIKNGVKKEDLKVWVEPKPEPPPPEPEKPVEGCDCEIVIGGLRKDLKGAKAEIAALKEDMKFANEQYGTLKIQYNTARNDLLEWQEKYSILQKESEVKFIDKLKDKLGGLIERLFGN